MLLPQDNIYYKGDSIELEFQLYRNKSINQYWDLTNHQIRFQLGTGTNAIKKATANVSGGSNSQIEITNAVQGIFIIRILKTETSNLATGNDYDFEIEVTTPAPAYSRYTVLQAELRLLPEMITWDAE